jgi:hypothetical protein
VAPRSTENHPKSNFGTVVRTVKSCTNSESKRFAEISGLPTNQPYRAKGAICQVASGVPGLPLLVIVVPFISQM